MNKIKLFTLILGLSASLFGQGEPYIVPDSSQVENSNLEVDSLLSLVELDSLINEDSVVVISKGTLVIDQERRLDELLEKYSDINKDNCPNLVKGFRIQIFSASGTGSNQRAREARTKFLTLFAEMEAYNDYNAPNFRVRVGNYRSKLEAEKYKKKISQEFPSCFIVPCFIETELIKDCK